MNALDAPDWVVARALRPGDGHCIECGVPEMAQHLDSCPSAPIWAAMCAEQGNPLSGLWSPTHGTLIFDTEPRDRSGLEGRSLIDLLDDANLTINYKIDPCQREFLDRWYDAPEPPARRRDWRAIWRRILWGTEGR